MDTFRGFPKTIDEQALKNKAENERKRTIQIFGRLRYPHRSRGFTKFRKDLEEAIENSIDVDYRFAFLRFMGLTKNI